MTPKIWLCAHSFHSTKRSSFRNSPCPSRKSPVESDERDRREGFLLQTLEQERDQQQFARRRIHGIGDFNNLSPNRRSEENLCHRDVEEGAQGGVVERPRACGDGGKDSLI